MAHEFRLEDPGEGLHEAEILEIPVSEGDKVTEGDTVVVIETDKAAMEIPAPVTGEVQEIRISVGDTAEVGDVLMIFGESGGGGETEEQSDDSSADEETDNGAGEEAGDDSPDDAKAEDENAENAKDDDDNAEDVTESGSKDTGDEDNTGDKPEHDDEAKPAVGEDGSPTGDKPYATPAVRGLAREMGVDLAQIKGSGEDGRILKQDVRAAANGGEEEEATGETVVKLRSLRRTTARRMTEAWREIPHVTHQDVIEITALERLRRDHADDIEKQGGSLTLTPFIVKALAIALAEFPNFNATFDADACAVHQLSACNIGVALDTDRGLLVPVLRDAGRRSIADLALELTRLGERLREGVATREELRGATFTVTNVGAIGGTGLAPIINPPQTAIFGVARAELRNVVRGDIDDHTTDIALCLPVSLTFDHRVADGAEAARFVARVKALLDDPGALVLNS